MKLIIVSNRLPLTVRKIKGKYKADVSVAGLTSAIMSYFKGERNVYEWVGWPGSDVKKEYQQGVTENIRQTFSATPIYFDEKEIQDFYEGFCNQIIWPLFHYMPSLCKFDELYWQSYKKSNARFADAVLSVYEDGDIIFIQDYHLMLLPELLRQKLPKALIGFFLHIPFPNYEIFRILPSTWRTRIIRGLLGADLVGFHTEEYAHYFLHAVSKTLGLDHKMGVVLHEDRLVEVGAFPIGIDYANFKNALKDTIVKKEKHDFQLNLAKKKVIISVDRLDYSKGILNRLEGYETFLEKYKEYHSKVVLVVIAVPSRTNIDEYQNMKQRIEEKISFINGKYGTIEWSPILYQYKEFNVKRLQALYAIGDIALVTPLRDGMNLVAKEYVVTKGRNKGVLILSEFAGAAKELKDALIINPSSREEIAWAIHYALRMSTTDQKKRLNSMNRHLKKHDITWWFQKIYERLYTIQEKQMQKKNILTTNALKESIRSEYKKAQKRLVLLDYDGTLAPFAPTPQEAKPTPHVTDLLKQLTSDPKNTVAIISGRDTETMSEWFGKLGIYLIAEHGAYTKNGGNWEPLDWLTDSWKPEIRPILEKYVARVPESIIEEKNFSLVWHFRKSDEKLAEEVAQEMVDELSHFTANSILQVMYMKVSKVVEVKVAGVNKGSATIRLYNEISPDFCLCIGDDVTDEDMFTNLPQGSYTIKVGTMPTEAQYRVSDPFEVQLLLETLVDEN